MTDPSYKRSFFVFKIGGAKTNFRHFKNVISGQKRYFKNTKNIKYYKIHKKLNLDHYALIFIFSLKFSLLKLFHRPRATRAAPRSSNAHSSLMVL